MLRFILKNKTDGLRQRTGSIGMLSPEQCVLENVVCDLYV